MLDLRKNNFLPSLSMGTMGTSTKSKSSHSKTKDLPRKLSLKRNIKKTFLNKPIGNQHLL